MNKYLQIIKTSSSSTLNYRSELVGLLIRKSLEVLFLSIFWSIAVESSDFNVSTTEIVSYFVLVSASAELIMTDRFYPGRHISGIIKDGKLNGSLIKPINELVFHYLEDIGNRIPVISISLLLFIVAALVNGTSVFGFLLSILFVSLAFFIGISLNLLIASTTFYIVENFAIVYGFQITTRILSGAFIPLYFFPDAFAKLLEFTPLPYLAYIPIEYITSGTATLEQTIERIFVALIWGIVLFIISVFIWEKSLNKYEATGI